MHRRRRHPDSGGQLHRSFSQSLHVDGQEEFDHYWFALLDGGNASKNGWLVDKFGIWWDIVPIQQMQIFSSASPDAMQRIAVAAQSMERIDIAELERAAAGN